VICGKGRERKKREGSRKREDRILEMVGRVTGRKRLRFITSLADRVTISVMGVVPINRCNLCAVTI